MKGACRMARAGVVVAALALAACLPAVAFGGASRHALAAKVTVTFTDTKLVVSPGHLQAGLATLVVVNNGQKLHVLTIKGPGLKGARIQKVAAGASATLTVRFSAGAYMLSDLSGLAASNVRWLVVGPATVVKATGSSSVVVPLTDPSKMDCD
jgi:hypothetical protein